MVPGFFRDGFGGCLDALLPVIAGLSCADGIPKQCRSPGTDRSASGAVREANRGRDCQGFAPAHYRGDFQCWLSDPLR